jgi:hypothetical protein
MANLRLKRNETFVPPRIPSPIGRGEGFGRELDSTAFDKLRPRACRGELAEVSRTVRVPRLPSPLGERATLEHVALDVGWQGEHLIVAELVTMATFTNSTEEKLR